MARITWEFDTATPVLEHAPATVSQAVALLAAGNAEFAGIDPASSYPHLIRVGPGDLGFGASPGVVPQQTPFAAVLGCADARVPLELVLLQSANDLFVLRVAGNVLGAECVGSIDYAIEHIPSIRLLGVVGHTGCGAVSATVDAYLHPRTYLGVSANLPLRAIIDAIMPAVRGADESLQYAHGSAVTKAPGFRAALIDAAVMINTAVTADAIKTIFAPHLNDSLGVAFGVYDLASRQVGLPTLTRGEPVWTPGMVYPPKSEDIPTFIEDLVKTAYLESLLLTQPAAGQNGSGSPA